MSYKCIIFDCDGVLVDSESLSAKIFREMAIELGFDLDYQTAVEQFAGTSMNENLRFIEDNIEGDLPEGFEQEFRQRTYAAFEQELKAVEGIHELLRTLKVPFCVASSGPPEKIRLNLGLTGLLKLFEGRIYSSYSIGSWKPEPGIFLHAADQMGFKPSECIVIEDSTAGVRAAIAGGFKVYALSKPKKKETFEGLGATTFSTMAELANLLKLES